ncbi:MAG: nucleotide exchange factor GrpE [Anaerolineae bacterium]
MEETRQTDEVQGVKPHDEGAEEGEALVTPVETAHPRVEQLESELAEVKGRAAEYLDGWQRARADMANYRRRTEAERATLVATANGRLLTRLLPVLDDFERAFETLPAELRNLTWIQGIGMIYRKLQMTVEGEGATPIDAVGQPFDPNIHDAIMQEESHDYPSGTVIAELQRGYRLGDRVLRPAMVKVSSGPGPASQSGGAASPEEGTEA